MPPPREHNQPQDEEDDDTAGVVKLISAEGFEFVVYRKAAMVSNLLVVLCGNHEAQPVVNTGSLY